MRYKILVLTVFLAFAATFAGCVVDAGEGPTSLQQACDVPDAMPPTPDAMPPAPDAMPPTPDAMPPTPDAMPPEPGCTLTPGYWKNHSNCGNASSRDATWDDLPEAEATPFFESGYTMCEVMWVSPKGNAYYILARAFVAAKLNQLADADFSEATSAFDLAMELFEEFTPAQIALMRGNDWVRSEFIRLAGILDAFNNGRIGPGHCDDDDDDNGCDCDCDCEAYCDCCDD